jgi:hypothetical protein
MKRTLRVLSLCTIVALPHSSAFAGEAAPEQPRSFSATVPAKGSHTVIVPVAAWGRYSVQSRSEQPIAFSIADRRSGVICSDGEVGERNGRIDMFFDIGEYKISTQGPKKATANAVITATPFRYPAGITAAYLVPCKENRLQLHDLEQCAFWFEAVADTTIYVEACGRYLEDVRLWRDGEWLVPTQNSPFVARPKAETPLSGIVMTAAVPKGNYMVAAYGGKGRDWSVKSNDAPLYLQGFLETLDGNVTMAMTIPPKGYVHMKLSPLVRAVVVEEADRKALYMEIPGSGIDSIHAKSSAPRMMLSSYGSGSQTLKIRGKPGQCFTLQTIGTMGSIPCQADGSWWVSSMHTGNFRDQLGASGAIIGYRDTLLLDGRSVRIDSVFAVCADTISPDKEIAKRFNFLSEGSMTAYVWVSSEGTHWVSPGGAGFSWKFKRYFTSTPPDYKEPEMSDKSGSVDLNRGLYILEIYPKKKGIASLVIQKTSLIGSVFKAGKELVTGPDDNRAWVPQRPCVQFPSVKAKKNYCLSILLNNQSPELGAVEARRLPLDPDVPFALWCRAGEKIQVPLQLRGKRVIALIDERGAAAPYEINGTRFDKSATFDPGDYTIAVPAGSQDLRRLVLKATPVERIPSEPPPPFPDEKRLSLPSFPRLAVATPSFLDLDRTASTPYAITVSQPGIYRIETTGRLATRLMIRDRFLNFTRDAQSNGIGRNALICEYLLSGTYQIDVGTIGRSAGRLGLSAYQNPLVACGTLEAGIDNRAFIPAYSGATYDVAVSEAGNYKIESVGQSGNFSFRFEDKDGWPFDPALSSGPQNQMLVQSTYRLISLPTMQDSRRIARLTMNAAQRTVKGKGPHHLDINAPLSLVWEEEKGKSEPAVFTVTVPAPISATLTTTDGFTGTLYKTGVDSARAVWNGKKAVDLDIGTYRITVQPKNKGNHAPFQVAVTTRDLIAGLSYTLSKPQMLRVSMGATGVAEIGSQGMLDVSGMLYESDAKTVIAKNDDGFLDWNFALSRVLRPGRYFLRVEGEESNFTSTAVFMRVLADTLMDTLTCRDSGRVAVKCDVRRRLAVFPLSTADTGDVLACAARGRSRIGISIEKQLAANSAWAIVTQRCGAQPSLSIPRQTGNRYRLKVWSEGNVDESFELTYLSTMARFASWKDAQGGLTGQARSLGKEYCAWFKLDLADNAPGHFLASARGNQLTGIGTSAAVDSLFINESPAWFGANNRYVWTELRFEEAGGFKVKLDQMRLKKGDTITMPLSGNKPRVFAAPRNGSAIGLLTVESDGAVPLAGIVVPAPRSAQTLSVGGIAVRQDLWIDKGRSAAIVLREDAVNTAVWNALPSPDVMQPTAVITWNEFPLDKGATLGAGTSSWKADAPSAHVLHYSGKDGSILARVTLPPATAALVTHRGGSRAIACAFGSEPIVQEFCTDSGDLYLIALRSDVRFTIAAYAATDGTLSDNGTYELVPGRSWQVKMLRDGTLTIPLSSDMKKSFQFFKYGAIQSAGWIGPNGVLRQDLYDGARIGPGGMVTLSASEGWIKLNLCDAASAGGSMACKWGSSITPTQPSALNGSSIVNLHTGENWFTFKLHDTQHVNLGAPMPVAAILLKNGAPVNYQEAWELFNWDLPLAPGSYALGIHPIAGSSIEGGRMTALFRPLERLSEKQPFTTYLAAGESRLLSFTVAKKDRFGIGLRMARETVQSRLYDARGAILDQGKQQFVALEKGTYYLWIRVPASGEGTDVTVFLFGQEPPPNEPPAQLVRWIINGAQGERPVIRTTGGDERSAADNRPVWERMLEQEQRHVNTIEPSEEGQNSEGSYEGESSEGSYEGEEQEGEQQEGEQQEEDEQQQEGEQEQYEEGE